MPKSPPDGLMLPMKAISSTKANVSAAGKTRPVKTISPAPARNRLRSSNRGATKPVSRVSAAVPSSEALATMPMCCGLKPIGRQINRQNDDGKAVAESAQRAGGVQAENIGRSFVQAARHVSSPKTERDNAWLRAADRAVADDPGSRQIITQGAGVQGEQSRGSLLPPHHAHLILRSLPADPREARSDERSVSRDGSRQCARWFETHVGQRKGAARRAPP